MGNNSVIYCSVAGLICWSKVCHLIPMMKEMEKKQHLYLNSDVY